MEYLLKPVDDARLKATIKHAMKMINNLDNNFSDTNQVPDNPIIKQVKDYIYNNISQDVSRMDIANHVGFNPEYLSTVFHRETGQTLTVFIRIERVHFSMQLLRQTNLPISIISENVGFQCSLKNQNRCSIY